MKRTVLGLLLAILSAGWLAPLWLAVSSLFSYWHEEAMPLILHRTGTGPVNSLSHFQLAYSSLEVAIIWLGAAIAVWSCLIFTRFKPAA